MAVKAEPKQEERRRLTDDHRCDACGARAYYEVELINDAGEESVLLFCGHHFTHHEQALHDVALDIHDHSHHLAV